jgi:hypothetical protein
MLQRYFWIKVTFNPKAYWGNYEQLIHRPSNRLCAGNPVLSSAGGSENRCHFTHQRPLPRNSGVDVLLLGRHEALKTRFNTIGYA